MSLFLSGAMVVAFAPAVAAPLAEAWTGDGGDEVTVTFDPGAGAAAQNGVPSATATVSKAVAADKQAAVTAAEGEVQTAQDAVAAAEGEVEEKQNAVDAAEDGEKEAAETALAKAETELETAGGNLAEKQKALASAKEAAEAATTYTLKLPEDARALSNKDNGYALYTDGTTKFSEWVYDADGKLDTTDDQVAYSFSYSGDTLTNGGLEVTGIDNVKSITLYATYKTPGIEIDEDSTISLSPEAQAGSGKSAVTLGASNLKKGTYNIVATAGGKDFTSEAFTVASDYAAAEDVTVNIDNSAIKAGEISFKVIVANTTTEIAGATATLDILTATFRAGDYGTFFDEDAGTSSSERTWLVSKGAARPEQDPPTPQTGSSLAATTWLLEDGKTVPGTVDSNLVIVAQYDNAKVETLSFEGPRKDGTKAALTYKLANLPATENTKDYKVTISKDGAAVGELTLTPSEAKKAAGKMSDEERTFSFDQDYDTATGTKASPAAGTYTVTAVAEFKPNTTGNTAVSVTKSVSVAAVTFDANGGKAPSNWKAYPQFVQVGSTLAGFDADNAQGVTNEDTTKEFAGWSADGAAKVDPAKFTVSGDTVLKALWADKYVAAPELASATEADGKWTLEFTEATAGAAMTYAIGDLSYGELKDGKVTVDPEKGQTKVVVTASPASGSKLAPKSTTVISYNGASGVAGDAFQTSSPTAVFDTFAKAVLNQPTPDDQTKPVYYSTVLTTALADGEAALKAVGYAALADFAKAEVAQERAVLAAAAGYAATVLDGLSKGKAAEDGTVTRVTSSAQAEAKAAIDQVLADFDVNKGVVEKGKAVTVTSKTAGGEAYAKAITGAVKAAAAKTEKVAKAVTDVEADIAAIPAAPAADATDEAKKAYADAVAKAQGSYAALSDAQKATVSAASVASLYAAADVQAKADLAAAQADLEAAQKAADEAKAAASDPSKNEALKAAQDKADSAQKAADAAQADADAAAAKVKAAVKATKPAATVKAGKKKLTVKASKGTLEKLGKVTYKYRCKKGAKAGGKWKALKAGKAVTVKKLKKGKKYTVQVKATVDGTAAKTFKKTVKVK